MSDIAFSLLLTWWIMVTVHLVWECYLIVTRGFENLPRCRRWWCPDGIKNRIEDRGK